MEYQLFKFFEQWSESHESIDFMNEGAARFQLNIKLNGQVDPNEVEIMRKFLLTTIFNEIVRNTPQYPPAVVMSSVSSQTDIAIGVLGTVGHRLLVILVAIIVSYMWCKRYL